MSLSPEYNPIFISILLDLYDPAAATTPTQHLQMKTIPKRLEGLGVLSAVECAQLEHARPKLEVKVREILGDWRVYTT
jgi:hypothetical protein